MTTIAKGTTLERFSTEDEVLTFTPGSGGYIRFDCSAPSGVTRPTGRQIRSATSISIQSGCTVFAEAVGADATYTTDGGAAAVAAALSGSRYAPQSLGARRPSSADNASLGYANGSLWRTDAGDIFQASGVTSSDATWTPLPRVAGGVGNAVAGVQFSGGTVRTIAAYGTGPALDISVTIASTPTAATINYLPSGELNEQQIQALVSRADAGTHTLVTKAYNNDASGNDAVIQSPQLGMILRWSPMLKRYAIYGDRSGKYFLTLPIAIAANTKNFSMFAIGEGSSSGDNGSSCLGQVGAAGNIASGSAGGFRLQTWGGYVTMNMVGGGSTSGLVTPTANVPVVCTPQVTILTGGSSDFSFTCNEYSSTKPNNYSSVALTGGFIGGDGVTTGMYPMVPFVQFVITNAALTAAETLAVKQIAYNLVDVLPQVRDLVVIDGDSRTQYTNTTSQDNVSRRIAEDLNKWAVVVNVGQGSATTQTRTSAGIPAAAATLKLGGRYIVTIPALGVNQFVINGESVSTALSNLTGYYSLHGAQGAEVSTIAELKTSVTTGSANTNVPLLRTAMLAAGASGLGIDALIDVSANAAAANISNYPDGTHQNTLVHSVMAAALRPTLRTQSGLSL